MTHQAMALVVLLSALAGACEGDSGGDVTAEAQAAGVYASLKPSTIGALHLRGPALRDAVIFVDCQEADKHVDGALDASAALVEPEDQRLCYVELIDEEPVRYAGAIIVRRTWEAEDNTLLDAIDAGAVIVSVSAGVEKKGSFAGTDPDAPGGGFAQFDLDDEIIGRVVRLRADRSQAMFSITTAAGPTRVEVTSQHDPGTVVEMARTAFGDPPVGTATQ